MSQASTRRSRIAFYATLLLASLLLIYPLPSLLTVYLPMSKPLWTPPFVIQTVGITLISWLLASLIDVYPSIPIPGIRLLEVLEEAERAGGKIKRPAERADWGGTTGAFADPDGYVWEVAHNPGWSLDEQGAVTI